MTKGNTFGTTAFTSYGLFWISLVALILMPKFRWISVPSTLAMTAYLFMWGLFTLFMYFGTIKKSIALQFVFMTLAILFFLLALGDFTGIALVKTIAGYEGIICGFSAIYLAIAEVLNETYGRTILPIGE